MEQKIPYKIYLAENEIPTQWYNVRADMKVKPAPLIHPGDGHPLTSHAHQGRTETFRQDHCSDFRRPALPQSFLFQQIFQAPDGNDAIGIQNAGVTQKSRQKIW